MKNITMNEINKGKKNFLVCFWKITTKDKQNRYKITGILFPEIIIAIKKIKNRIGIKKYKYFFDLSLKKNGNIKKEKIENLCIYPPAMNSSPNGPEKCLPPAYCKFVLVKPKISLPNVNCIKISKATNNEKKLQVMKKNLKLRIFLDTKNLKTMYRIRYLT